MNDNLEYTIQRLNSALEVSGRTIKNMETKLANMQTMVTIMEAEKKQWEQQKVLQEKIIQQQLQASDENVRKLQQEILELRAKLKAA